MGGATFASARKVNQLFSGTANHKQDNFVGFRLESTPLSRLVRKEKPELGNISIIPLHGTNPLI